MKLQIGDLVKHLRLQRGRLGIITAVRSAEDNNGNMLYFYDVLWNCGKHSAHAGNWLWQMETK